MITNSKREIAELTDTFQTVCNRLVNLTMELKLKKATLERETATLDYNIRSNARTKKTETAIKNEIILSESYIKLTEGIIETERQLDEAKYLKQELELKAEMLKLLGSDYIAVTNVQKDKKTFKKR